MAPGRGAAIKSGSPPREPVAPVGDDCCKGLLVGGAIFPDKERKTKIAIEKA